MCSRGGCGVTVQGDRTEGQGSSAPAHPGSVPTPAKRPHPTAQNQLPVSPPTLETVPVPCSHLARRDMVRSLGHIHRSEEPPSTASVIAGHPGHEFGDTSAPLTVTDPAQQGWQSLCFQMPTESWSFQPGCRGKKQQKFPKNQPGKSFVCGIERVRSRNVTSVTGWILRRRSLQPPPSQEGSTAWM